MGAARMEESLVSRLNTSARVASARAVGSKVEDLEAAVYW